MSGKTLAFVDLEKAFWLYVDRFCPHPLQSRHRYSWVRENLSFELEGIVYERRTETHRPAGSVRGITLVRFTGSDGTIVEDELAAQSLAARGA